MRQQQTFRGFIFIPLMLILIITTVRFPYARQANKITNQDFIKILKDDQTTDVDIYQNSQTPTGEMVPTLLDGQMKRLHVSDVKNAQRLLDIHDMTYATMDMPQENYLVATILPLILPIMVVVIIVMVMNRSAGDRGANTRMANSGRSRARMSRDSKINFSNVANLMEEEGELEEMVDFLKNSQKYTSVGARILEGLLLVGPSGTGKTLLAKVVADGAGAPFFSISSSDFVEMFVDAGVFRVRDLFEETKKNSPCTVFIDKIDAVTCRRGIGMGGGRDEGEQTLSQLLVEMNGFGTNEGVIVMAATNRMDILDPAILRSGRFDRKVAVGRPNVERREEILKVHSKEKPLNEGMDLHRIAQTTSGLTGADLENPTNEAAIMPAKGNRRFIKQSDIGRAFIKVGIGAEKRSKVVPKKDKKITAYHETDRTILLHVLPGVGPVHTVSIIPTGVGAADYTMPLPERDEMFNTKGRMMQNTMVDLGSRVTGELVFDDTTTGASQDIKQVTQIARAMVTQYDMSRKMGMIQHGGDEDEVSIGRDLAYAKSYDNEVADTIDSEVRRIIDKCYQRAKDIIKQYDYVPHACATLLIKKEEVSQPKFETLFAPAQ